MQLGFVVRSTLVDALSLTLHLKESGGVTLALGVTQFTADDPPCRRRQAVFRAATGGNVQSFRSWIQILNPLIEGYNSQTGRDPRFGRLKEVLAIEHDDLKVPGTHLAGPGPGLGGLAFTVGL